MSIVPLDLQVLYANQNNVSRIEHTRAVEKSLVMQAEDSDLTRDSYEKDSTVVKMSESEKQKQLKEKEDHEEHNKDNAFKFVMYRKKKGKKGLESDSFEEVYTEGKGRYVDVFS